MIAAKHGLVKLMLLISDGYDDDDDDDAENCDDEPTEMNIWTLVDPQTIGVEPLEEAHAP